MQNKDLSYFIKLLNNEFYKNDKEFLHIIRKLTSQTADFNNKTISLFNILSEAEKTKLEMIQKEKELGLKENEKPYGHKKLDEVKNDILVYKTLNNQKKEMVEKFIYILDNFFEVKDISKRKLLLEEVVEILDFFELYEINPLNFIINPNRAKVWHIIQNDYKVTLKKVNIDLFIEKIKLAYLKHSATIEAIKDFYENKEDIQKELKITEDEERITELKNELDKELDVNIEPLLIDTHEILESLDVMLEEIPNELEESQKVDLIKFMPAISEYYIDQIYALSGGISYTPLSKHLKEFQELIDKGVSVKVLFEEVITLQNTLQHLYILHWIAESLLQEILKCFDFRFCSFGKTIYKYKKKYQDTNTNFNNIKKAVNFRNKVAHSGYLWKPVEIEESIKNYREYISQVSKERNFDLNEFYLDMIDRKITPELLEKRYIKFLKEETIDEKLIDEELKNKIIKRLSDKKVNKKKIKAYIKAQLRENFAVKYFDGLDFKTIESYLHLAEEKGVIKPDSGIKMYDWTMFNSENKNYKQDVKKNIKKIKAAIEKVSDIKFKKDFLGGIFGR